MSEKQQSQPDADLPATFDLMEMLVELDPGRLEVEQLVGEGLVLRYAGRPETSGVTVRPCFPVTQPERHLIFRDAEGKEIGLLDDLNALREPSRRALHAELNKQHFVPVITRVDAIYQDSQIPVWQVQTDRGPRRLELRSNHDVHRVGGGRIYLRDAEGNGYLIPDVYALDRRSQEIIDLYV